MDNIVNSSELEATIRRLAEELGERGADTAQILRRLESATVTITGSESETVTITVYDDLASIPGREEEEEEDEPSEDDEEHQSADDSSEDDDQNTPDGLDALLLDVTDDLQTLPRDFVDDPELFISNDDEDDDVLYSFVNNVRNIPGGSAGDESESEPESEPESENSHVDDGDTSLEDAHEDAAPDTRRVALRRTAATALGEGQDTEAPPAKRRKTEEETPPLCTDQDCAVKCPVCMDCSHKIHHEGRHLVATQCGHVFCQGCLDAAINHRRRCPNCRARISRNRNRPLYL